MFYSKKESSSSSESDDEETKVLFMGIDTQNDVDENKNGKDEENS